MKKIICTLFGLGLGTLLSTAAPRPNIPDEFPRFTVPGHEREMDSLRDLFWLHYPGTAPQATLWDEWLTEAAFWPATLADGQADKLRAAWRRTLLGRIVDPEGYVATHQHPSITHQLGWPFPFWIQGRRGCGWHFSFKNTVGEPWRPHDLSKPDGWGVEGGYAVGVEDEGWRLEVTNVTAVITAAPWKCHTYEVPFLQIRWRVEGLTQSEPFIEWTTPKDPQFSADRRMFFALPTSGQMAYQMIPMYRHPQWTGEVAQIRIGLGNRNVGKVVLQAFFSHYDTRHNINEANFIRGSAKYFWWTRDLGFLRDNLQRMRMALRYTMTEHQALERNMVVTTWVGHDGRSGLKRKADGSKEIFTGQGIGNNYWDLLPFGNLDCYATIQYYDALRTMIAIEREVRAHPEWQMPLGVLAMDPARLEQHASEVKSVGNRTFWNPRTRRFGACVDVDGELHDYGFTFLNLEAIYYDFATDDHAEEIMAWLDGKRIVEGDTSQGADIYHWCFGPRSTTLRNVDWYFWAWNVPESIPWGGQVQDGGAVLGFSYHDLMSRLKTQGPDEAWSRLREVTIWFQEVQTAGGYREYYDGKREGLLQGGGTAGGLGLDKEFFESVLVPQAILYGFMGFEPAADGFAVNPRLPQSWPELGISRIRFQGNLFNIRATPGSVEIDNEIASTEPVVVRLPLGTWKGAWLSGDGDLSELLDGGAFRLTWRKPGKIQFSLLP